MEVTCDVTQGRAECLPSELHLQSTSFGQSQSDRGHPTITLFQHQSICKPPDAIDSLKTLKTQSKPAREASHNDLDQTTLQSDFVTAPTTVNSGRSFIRPFVTSYPGKWQVPKPGPGLVPLAVLDSSAYLQKSIPLMQIQIRSPS